MAIYIVLDAWHYPVAAFRTQEDADKYAAKTKPFRCYVVMTRLKD